MTRFVLVRHGQTAWNHVERFRGRADLPLNESGLAQAAATGRRVAQQWQPAAVYASPMTRAVQTGQAIADRLGLAVQHHLGLQDIDFGEWQGLTPDEARLRWPEMVAAWYGAPHTARPSGGETLADLRSRAIAMLDELCVLHPGQMVVLVGHTVINRVILLAVLGLGNEHFWLLAQDTCAINVFERANGVYYLIKLNDTCHLSG